MSSPVQGAPVHAQLLWEAAQRACERSQALIAESRATLVRHTEAVAALRSSLLTNPSPVLPRVTSDGHPERTVDLDGEVVLGQLTLVPLRRAIACDGGRILFTPAEWQLLAALVMNRGSTLSRAELATHAWDELGDTLQTLVASPDLSAQKRLRAALAALVTIGRSRPHLYRLMFTMPLSDPTAAVRAATRTHSLFPRLVGGVVGALGLVWARSLLPGP